MGGTIASGASTPTLSTVIWAGMPAYGSASDAAVVGGGPGSFGSAPAAMQQPAVQSMLSNAAPAAQPQPAAAPVPAAAPMADIQAALTNLVGVLQKLVAALQAQQGAGGVQGGGGGMSGCSCGAGAGGGGVSQASGQAGGANAAPGAAVQEARSDKPKQSASGGGASAAQAAAPAAPAAAAGGVREKIVAKAREELARNVTEDAGSDKDSGGNIRKYRTAVTGPGENPDLAESWCADFASWLWKEAGVPWGPEGKGDDYTPTMVELAKKTGTWKAQDPQPGDMVFIDWQGGEGVDHVAIVEKVENGKVHTIAGNESERIKAASYPIGDARMMGFVSPKGT